MEVQVMIGLLALGVIGLAVLLTVIWQRQTRMGNRLSHVEHEVGIHTSESERAQAEEHMAKRKGDDETLRGRLHAVEQKTGSNSRRISRMVKQR